MLEMVGKATEYVVSLAQNLVIKKELVKPAEEKIKQIKHET